MGAVAGKSGTTKPTIGGGGIEKRSGKNMGPLPAALGNAKTGGRVEFPKSRITISRITWPKGMGMSLKPDVIQKTA